MSGRRLRRIAVVLLVLSLAVLGLGAWYDRPPVPPGRWLAAGGLEPREAVVDGRRLRFVRAGAGPPVVLVHGFGSSIYTWKDVLPLLARAHDVVALDLPGFGGSDQPADLSFDDFPRAVLGLMDALSLEQAALVGNSLGGAAAVLVASRHPGRVSALVLVDSAGFNLEESDRPAMIRLVLSGAGRLLSVLPLRRLAVERSLRQVFHDPSLVTDERVSEYLAPLLRPGALDSIRSLGRRPARDAAEFERALAGVSAPTLVVWGGEDAWVPLAHADRFAAAIPGAERVVLERCGHVPQEEKPAEVARLVGDFLVRALPAGEATSARE